MLRRAYSRRGPPAIPRLGTHPDATPLPPHPVLHRPGGWQRLDGGARQVRRHGGRAVLRGKRQRGAACAAGRTGGVGGLAGAQTLDLACITSFSHSTPQIPPTAPLAHRQYDSASFYSCPRHFPTPVFAPPPSRPPLISSLPPSGIPRLRGRPSQHGQRVDGDGGDALPLPGRVGAHAHAHRGR
jgi:hypothetical protein